MPLTRSITDALKSATVALPAQNTSVTSASINLENVPVNDNVQLRVAIPATPNLANGQTLTVTIQDSADDISYATLTGIRTTVVTGPASGGGLLTVQTDAIPLHVRQYVRASIAASATAGNNTAVSATVGLAF